MQVLSFSSKKLLTRHTSSSVWSFYEAFNTIIDQYLFGTTENKMNAKDSF